METYFFGTHFQGVLRWLVVVLLRGGGDLR